MQGNVPRMIGSSFVTAERPTPRGFGGWSTYPSLDLKTVLPFLTEGPVAKGRERHMCHSLFFGSTFLVISGGDDME